MEQYIYIFTILLEIIVAYQLASAIIKLDKKVVQINKEVFLLKDEVRIAMINFRRLIVKFNKVASIIIKIKRFNLKRLLLIGADIINLVMLFKSFRAYRGLNKLQFLKKMFSYSLIRGLISKFKNAF